MTLYDAIKAGVDRLVVGSPILRHSDPKEAVKLIIEEIQAGLEG